jgi:hypothetical protein
MNDPQNPKRKKPVDVQELKDESPDDPRIGQGFNDARGEVPDKEDVPKNNGQNVRNDPAQAKPQPPSDR